MDVDLYNNAGWTMDLSFAVMERAMFHSDNSYHVPALRATGHCCKTNLPSNTAFRGFGGPQGKKDLREGKEKPVICICCRNVCNRNMDGAHC